MSAAAAAAGAEAGDQDPSRELTTPQDRQGWFRLDPERFTDMCGKAYVRQLGLQLRERCADGKP